MIRHSEQDGPWFSFWPQRQRRKYNTNTNNDNADDSRLHCTSPSFGTCVTMSARHWGSWKRSRIPTWSRLDWRMRIVIRRAGGNSNLRTTSNGTTRPVLSASSHVQTRWEDMTATNRCKEVTSSASARCSNQLHKRSKSSSQETMWWFPCLTGRGLHAVIVEELNILVQHFVRIKTLFYDLIVIISINASVKPCVW